MDVLDMTVFSLTTSMVAAIFDTPPMTWLPVSKQGVDWITIASRFSGYLLKHGLALP